MGVLTNFIFNVIIYIRKGKFMEFVDLNAVIKKNKPVAYPNKSASGRSKNAETQNLSDLSPLQCFKRASNFGHDPKLEKIILKSDNSFISYMYATQVKGARIRLHIRHIADDKNMDRDEKIELINDLKNLLNQKKEQQNG